MSKRAINPQSDAKAKAAGVDGWWISESPNGLFLMHNNYCVMRLDGRSPQELYEKTRA